MSFLQPIKSQLESFLTSLRSVESVYFTTDGDDSYEPDYRTVVVTLQEFGFDNDERRITFNLVVADKFPEGDVDAYYTSMDENFSIAHQLHDYLETDMPQYDFTVSDAIPVDRPDDADEQYPSMAVVAFDLTVYGSRKIGKSYDD